jgi:YHS domain-containing protein
LTGAFPLAYTRLTIVFRWIAALRWFAQAKMTFFARILWFLFWFLVIYWGVGLLKSLIERTLRKTGTPDAAGSAGAPQNVLSRRLVRDPVCGTHVAEALAVPLRQGSEVLHFCSTECRDNYLREVQRKAVNS